MIKKLGVDLVRHQQKRRIRYTVDTIIAEINFWPKIPPYLELEGDSKDALLELGKKLGFKEADVCELDAFDIYKDVYKIDLEKTKELVFH